MLLFAILCETLRISVLSQQHSQQWPGAPAGQAAPQYIFHRCPPPPPPQVRPHILPAAYTSLRNALRSCSVLNTSCSVLHTIASSQPNQCNALFPAQWQASLSQRHVNCLPDTTLWPDAVPDGPFSRSSSCRGIGRDCSEEMQVSGFFSEHALSI